MTPRIVPGSKNRYIVYMKFFSVLALFLLVVSLAPGLQAQMNSSALPSSPAPIYPPRVAPSAPPSAYRPVTPPNPSPAVVPPRPDTPGGGVVNPWTGEFYPGTFGGVVNPRTGEVLPKVDGGYYNPQTGEFIPRK
jgi:hypothetical protein